jgi:hypothetical protein
MAITTIRPHRATVHTHDEEHLEKRQAVIGTLGGVRRPARYIRALRRFWVFGLDKPIVESRRADSNR